MNQPLALRDGDLSYNPSVSIYPSPLTIYKKKSETTNAAMERPAVLTTAFEPAPDLEVEELEEPEEVEEASEPEEWEPPE